jgi:hypothetical protein
LRIKIIDLIKEQDPHTATVITVAISEPSMEFQPSAGLVMRDLDKKRLTTTRLLNRPDLTIEHDLTTAAGSGRAQASSCGRRSPSRLSGGILGGRHGYLYGEGKMG